MDKVLSRKLAKRIKDLRRERGWTQDEYSFRSGIKRSTLGSIETAVTDVALSKIKKLAKGFDMSLSEFLDF